MSDDEVTRDSDRAWMDEMRPRDAIVGFNIPGNWWVVLHPDGTRRHIPHEVVRTRDVAKLREILGVEAKPIDMSKVTTGRVRVERDEPYPGRATPPYRWAQEPRGPFPLFDAVRELPGEFADDPTHTREAMQAALEAGVTFHPTSCRCQLCDACDRGPWTDWEASRWLERRGQDHAGVAAALWAVTGGKRTESDGLFAGSGFKAWLPAEPFRGECRSQAEPPPGTRRSFGGFLVPDRRGR